MDYQTVFIIVIIIFFNLLLLNIFRLENNIYNLKSEKPSPCLIDKKIINNNNNNNNNNKKESKKDINKKLNEIASQVPIDINKICKSSDVLKPKYNQIKHI